MMGKLYFFYGTECTHCHEMDPLNLKLEKELKIKLEKVEVWHNEKNADFLRKLAEGKCMGIPFYYNENNKNWICGNTTYDELKKWAK